MPNMETIRPGVNQTGVFSTDAKILNKTVKKQLSKNQIKSSNNKKKKKKEKKKKQTNKQKKKQNKTKQNINNFLTVNINFPFTIPFPNVKA